MSKKKSKKTSENKFVGIKTRRSITCIGDRIADVEATFLDNPNEIHDHKATFFHHLAFLHDISSNHLIINEMYGKNNHRSYLDMKDN